MPLLSDEGRAKVNLTLRVNGRRADGYHDLESVVAFADCADRLTLSSGPELRLAASGPRAGECRPTCRRLSGHAYALQNAEAPLHFCFQRKLFPPTPKRLERTYP
jgi:4-diphosphocytidyl-2C-methyl-D-erythritol kinase